MPGEWLQWFFERLRLLYGIEDGLPVCLARVAWLIDSCFFVVYTESRLFNSAWLATSRCAGWCLGRSRGCAVVGVLWRGTPLAILPQRASILSRQLFFTNTQRQPLEYISNHYVELSNLQEWVHMSSI